MANTSTSLAHKASTLDVNSSQIDYANLFGTDFARLTNDYDKHAIYHLVSSEPDYNKRTILIRAIDCNYRMSHTRDEYEDFSFYLDSIKDLNELQKDWFTNSTKPTDEIPHSSVSDTVTAKVSDCAEEKGKGFSARQFSLLFYFIHEALDMHYYGEIKEYNLSDVQKMASTVSGWKEKSFDEKMLPFYAHKEDWLKRHENNALEIQSDMKDVKYVDSVISKTLPIVHDQIVAYLDQNDH